MKRREFLGAFGAAMMQPASRPNVVFILADDLGWGDLPCYGNRNTVAHGGWLVRGELKMPHLDRMAREGTRFTQFYVASAVCSPSRTGFMTGQFPSKLGIHDYLATPDLNAKRGVRDSLDPTSVTLPGLLQKAGYATAHFGKWHLSSGPAAPAPKQYGIGEYDECTRGQKERPFSSERIADATIRFIEAHRTQPFFINVWLHDPHSPLHPTDEMMAPYKELSPRWGTHRGAMEVYYGVLTEMDKHIGRILTKLDEAGLSGNTIVIFSSDNGPESGLIPFVSHYGGAASAGPFRGLKRSLYEGGIRTPWIVRWPGHTPANKVDNDTVFAAVDLLPTIAKLTGTAAPSVDGEDLSAALLGKTVKRTKPLLWENRYPVYGHVLDQSPMLAVRDGNWKLLLNPDRSRVELYDIPKDPSEMNNVAAQQPAVVKRLAERALAWRKTLPPGPIDPDAGKTTYAWPR